MCVPILLIPALIRGGQSRTDGSNRHSCGSTIVTPYGCNELYIQMHGPDTKRYIYMYTTKPVGPRRSLPLSKSWKPWALSLSEDMQPQCHIINMVN